VIDPIANVMAVALEIVPLSIGFAATDSNVPHVPLLVVTSRSFGMRCKKRYGVASVSVFTYNNWTRCQKDLSDLA
jgi:hypothetical protein